MKPGISLFRSIAPWLRAGSLITIIVLNLMIVAHHVVSRSVTTITFIIWITAIIVTIALLRPHSHNRIIKRTHAPIPFWQIIFLVFITTMTLVWFGTSLYHAHFDEQLTGYFSYTLPPISKIDWFGVYPERSQWVSQFPILYYALQKPFLLLWPSILMIRISTWPYTIGTVIILYFLIRRIRSHTEAFLTSICFIFLAPQLYLGSLGLHFHSSTFFFLFALFSFVRLIREHDYLSTVFLGVSLGASYMTYTASYITGPFIPVCMISVVMIKRKKELIPMFGRTMLIALVIIFPLVIYATRVNNFFLQRINQVSIFTGSWRATEETFHSIDELSRVITTHTKDAVRSLFLPDIGGMGDYWFGHLSFFENVGAFLFLFGLFVCFFMVWRGEYAILFILCAIAVPFVLSMILTTHPPPFHRWSIAYPLIGFILAQGIGSIQRSIQKISRNQLFNNLVILGITLLFASTNIIHAFRMIHNDAVINANDGITLASYLNLYVPHKTPIYVAAFPIYHLGRELLFRTENHYPITTEYLVSLTNLHAPAYLIVHRPDRESLALLFNRFPTAQPITINLRDHALFKL